MSLPETSVYHPDNDTVKRGGIYVPKSVVQDRSLRINAY